MVDESDTNNNNNSNNNNNKMANSRAKRRRSLFSVLFNSNSKSSSQENQQQQQLANLKDQNQKQIVLIKPQEAKCIEATIVALKNDKDNEETDVVVNGDKGDLFRRIKDFKKGKTREEDADSYVLELEDRLEMEKLRSINSAHKLSRSSSSIELAKRLSCESRQSVGFSRESSPLVGGLWQTNKNYVPIVETTVRQKASKTKTRQTSPMLEKFFSSYQIQFDSTSSNEDDSSCDSLTCPGRPPFTLNSKPSQLVASRRPISDLTDPAERLNHWQRLAGRNYSSIWNNSSSLDSDSELELLASDSPALVCYCSDDTSCSSVELIWSRPQLISSRQTQQPAKVNLLAPGRQDTIESQMSAARRSITNSTSDLDKSGQSRVQRAAIFELAKPSRARDRRIGVRGERRRRRRDDLDTHQTPSPLQAAVTAAAADDDKQETKRPGGRNSADWVANPLFSTQVSDDQLDVETKPTLATDEANPNSQLDLLESPNAKLIEELTKRLEKEEEQEENLDSFSLNGSSFCDRDKKHRWSLRVRSPIGLVRRDRAYLSHLVNLDKRIKSNVSSFKSQLSERISDTSKRASVLADQLITSIKDTTKEQILFTNTGRDRYDTLPNSFATSDRSSPNQPPTGANSFSGADPKKAELFSLIYKHQQQPNGQPVITSQPKPTLAGPVRPVVPPRPVATQTTTDTSKQPAANGAEEATKSTVHARLDSSRPSIYNTIASANIASRSNDLLITRKKRLRPRKARRQINVAALSADEEDEPDENTSRRFSSRSLNYDNKWKNNRSTNRSNVTY